MLIQIVVFKLKQAFSEFPVIFDEIIHQQSLDVQLITMHVSNQHMTIHMQMYLCDLHVIQHLFIQRGVVLELVDRHFVRMGLNIGKQKARSKYMEE